MSIVIRDCLGFALLRSVIGPENSRPLSTNHINPKLKPITTWSHALSHASGSLLVFTLNLIGSERYFSYLLIGLCNNFGLVLHHSIQKHPILKGFFSCRFNYTVASPSYKMNDLKQLLLELN